VSDLRVVLIEVVPKFDNVTLAEEAAVVATAEPSEASVAGIEVEYRMFPELSAQM
jgi:hypothetical protein